jgi:hypothetical protein
MPRNTRDMIRECSYAFGRPVNEVWARLTVTERELMGKLLFEEVVEYITKGLGLKITVPGWDNGDWGSQNDDVDCSEHLVLSFNEGQQLDPIECVDGLADINVVIHGNALWHGFDLDAATEIANDSNMSKLAEDGTPIINGVTPGYREGTMGTAYEPEPGFDPSKPIGKWLKGPNYWEPTQQLRQLIGNGAE